MRSIHRQALALRQELSRWLGQSRLMDGPCANGGGEDEANYALAFFPHYLVTRDPAILERCRSLLADLGAWVRAEGVHGYEPEAEAHHGTEPYILFLPRYAGLCPEDGAAAALIEDAAHHIGNWVDGVPAWYDYGRDCFYSYFLGTRSVGQDPAHAHELAEHFRFIHLALAAHRILGAGPYADWALRYGRRRAERLLAAEGPVPLLWSLEGQGLGWADLASRQLRSMAASSHHVEGDPLAGIENLLASGAVQALGDLYALSGDAVFQAAAHRLVEPLVPELLDPFADPAAVALAHYRLAFGDTSLDGDMAAVLNDAPPPSTREWALVLPEARRRREPGVGKRNDMLYWGEWADDGSARPLREPSTAALALGYELTGDPAWAERALGQAARKLAMARRVLRGGREHADMGGAICSVAAGHGRNWGAGAVTGCYGPLLMGTRDAFGMVAPALEFVDGDLPAPLPEGTLSLVRRPGTRRLEITLYNDGDEPVEVAWRLAAQRHGAPVSPDTPGPPVLTCLGPRQTTTYAVDERGEVEDHG
ncbi:MAG: hypothetical protein ABIL09_05975 [Gemmatimonadota bacterium]